MRWEDLFADLERQWEGMAAEERQAEIAERTRAEYARVTLLDRLRGSEGREIRMSTTTGQEVDGALAVVGADFVLLAATRQEHVLPLAALAAVSGLGPEAASAEVTGRVRARLGLGSVLRRIAADRSEVAVHRTAGPTLRGTVQRVGSDFLELAEHRLGESMAARPARRLTVVPFAAVALLTRAEPWTT